MIEDAAYDALRRYLEKLGSDARLLDPARATLTVIYDRQEAPRPKGDHVVIELLADRDLSEFKSQAWSELMLDGQPRVVLCEGRGVEFKFRIGVYSSRPIDWARLFATGLRSGEASVTMAPFVVRQIGEIERSPALIQQAWEGRCFFDVEIAVGAVNQLLAEVIETGEVTTSGVGSQVVTGSTTFAKP